MVSVTRKMWRLSNFESIRCHFCCTACLGKKFPPRIHLEPILALYLLSKGGMGQLVHKASGELCVLEHMVKVDMFDGVVGSVDVGVVVSERCLENEGRRVAIAVGRGMVRAGVSANTLLVGDVSVVANEQLEVLVLSRVGEVSHQAEALDSISARVANHVLVQHGHDLHVESSILAEDVLGAQ
jgi:hypothetical protein